MANKENINNSVDAVIDNAMKNLRDIIDVEVIVGKPIKMETKVILPVSKVCVGFVAGGGELAVKSKAKTGQPFAGGSGSGFTVTPVGFLVSEDDKIKYMSIEDKSPLNELIRMSNDLINKVMDDKEQSDETSN